MNDLNSESIKLYRSLLVFGICSVAICCTEFDLERVEFLKVITVGSTEVGLSSAFLLGDIEDIREAAIEEAGFLLSTSINDPASLVLNNSNAIKFESNEEGTITEDRAFAAQAINLESGTSYFFRAYGILVEGEGIVYGEIDSFSTIGFTADFVEVTRNGSGCPSQASLTVQYNVKGFNTSSLQFGIAWHNDLLSEPLVENNVFFGESLGSDGMVTLSLPVQCDEVYRVRPFIIVSPEETLYDRSKDFTTTSKGTWVQLADYPEELERVVGRPVSFSTQTNGYVHAIPKGQLTATFWKYDPKIQAWQPRNLPPFRSNPDNNRLESPGRNLFIGGVSTSSAVLFEYQEETDDWSELGIISQAVGPGAYLVHESQMYYGLGFSDTEISNDFMVARLDNLSSVTSISSFPGEPRTAPLSFIIGAKAYVGMGYDMFSDSYFSDYWEFDLNQESWTRVADIPEVMSGEVSFSFNGKGYVLTGVDIDGVPTPVFWEYDPSIDEWSRLADFARGDRNAEIGFVIDGIIYGGLGRDVEGNLHQEFWRYVEELK